MQATLVAVFLLPLRFDLDAMAGRRGEVTRSGIASWLSGAGFTIDEVEVGDLAIDGNRASIDAHLGQLTASRVAAVDGRPCRIVLTPFGTGFLLFDLEIEGCTALSALELSIVEGAQDLITSICSSLQPGIHLEPNAGGLTPGKLLWWHRILYGECPDQPGHIVRFGAAAEDLLVVADGYTTVSDLEADRDGIQRGLMMATEDWLVIDRSNRVAAGCMVSLRSANAARDLRAVETVHRSSNDLVSDLEIWLLLLEERTRFLTNEAAATRRAAHRAWDITDALAMLRSRVAAIADLATNARRDLVQALDERRNDLLFLMAGLAALQGLLVLADYVTGPQPEIASMLRLGSGAMILAVAAAMTWTTLRPHLGRSSDRAPLD